MPIQSLLDPIHVVQLGNLEIRARRLLDGLFSGHHRNRNRGTSKEFSEHRPYYIGDDIKTLDWKVFGRTDRLVVKQYEEETNILGTIVVDDSASMGFSAGNRISKLEYAKTLAAALGYLLISQSDSVSLITGHTILPARTQQASLEPFFDVLTQTHPVDSWQLTNLLSNASSILKKRTLFIVISDLMQDSHDVVSALRKLHAHKNDVLVIQVLDPAELNLEFSGSILFEDAETKETIRTEPEILRDAYQAIIKEKLNSLSNFVQRSGMEYIQLTTDTPFDRGLGAYLSWRRARI